jgi:uncharacterized protein YbjT (DUF2867 family)
MSMTRSSIVVTGGSGFVGSHLIALLASQGYQIMVPTRRLPRARHLLLLPGVTVVEADIFDRATLASLLGDAQACINLAGVLHSSRGKRGSAWGPQFERAHHALPALLAAACVEHGVPRLLHMSALGADQNGPSMYSRSKATSEAAIRQQAGLSWTIFRPSVIFGPGDNFLNQFARLQRHFPVMPLGGAETRFQPVYVGDVANAFALALRLPESIGQVVELTGPDVFTLRELVRVAGIWSGHPRPVIGLPNWLARIQALTLEFMPGGPLMSRDNLDSMKRDNVGSGAVRPAWLPAPTAIDGIAPYYLSGASRAASYERYRASARS